MSNSRPAKVSRAAESNDHVLRNEIYELFKERQSLRETLSAEMDENDRLRAENERLRNFARRVMQAWPHGDVDGGELQEIAIECGLLRREEMHKPCGHYCACLDFGAFEGLQDGETVTCYRRTDLLREQQEGER